MLASILTGGEAHDSIGFRSGDHQSVRIRCLKWERSCGSAKPENFVLSMIALAVKGSRGGGEFQQGRINTALAWSLSNGNNSAATCPARQPGE